MALLVPYVTALVLGSLHALEPDHMAAVTSFAVRRPGVRNAVRYGLRWALGHGGAIVVLGGALLAAGVHVPAGATHWLERLIGVVLVGLGGWTVLHARALHTHVHVHGDGTVHAHVHSHAWKATHDHAHAASSVGVLHGLAGTGAAVALVPVVGLEARIAGVGYLVVFAAGTAVAMTLYGVLAGAVAERAAAVSARATRALTRAAGLGTILIGCAWLAR
jgi:ABC-type nickel/cobalt efflux system permease component RcnA